MPTAAAYVGWPRPPATSRRLPGRPTQRSCSSTVAWAPSWSMPPRAKSPRSRSSRATARWSGSRRPESTRQRWLLRRFGRGSALEHHLQRLLAVKVRVAVERLEVLGTLEVQVEVVLPGEADA